MKKTDKMKNTKDIGIDLFEDYENIPKKVQIILDKYAEKFGNDFGDMDYKDMADMHNEIYAVGYTFESGLDNQPYDLRPIGTKGKSEMDEFRKGGSLDKENSDMVLNNNKQISHHTKELANAVNKNKNIPAWVVAKINRSATDISDATHYLEGAKYKKGGDVEKSIRGFKVGDDFYKTPSESGETRYYKITSIDDFNVKADDYDYVRNGTDVKTGKKSSFTNASFDYGVSQHKISRYDRGDFGYSKGGKLGFCYTIGGL
jgi:ribosomal protein L39E